MIIDQLFTRPLFEAADPSRLMVSITVQPMSTGGEPEIKEFDLTGMFQGSTVSQMNQAMDYMSKWLESKGMAFNDVRVSYQGHTITGQNRGAMAPQSDWEKEAEAKAAQMRARRPAQNATPAVKEVAPPGAKAERMVKHIKQGYARDGKLTPKEKGIAFATAWKAHNAGQVEEATDPKRDKLERMIWKYYGQIYDYGDDDGLDYLDRNGELWNQLMDKYNGEIDDIVAQEPTEVLMQAAQELKGIAGDMKYELDEADLAEGEVTKNATGLKHRATDKYGAGDDEPHHYTGGRSGFSEPGKYARDLEHVNKQLVKDLDASMGISWKNRGPKGLEVDEQDMAEGVVDTVKKIGKKLIKPVEVPGLNQMKAIHNSELKRELAAQNKKYAPKDVTEAEKNPHTSALGRALYRDLSKQPKLSPQQVQRNKERWAQRQAEREQGVAEGSSYNIDQDDHDEFTSAEIKRIKNSHFPDTLRDNLRAAKKEARRAKHFSSSSDGGDSKLGSPVGSASDNTYEGVTEGSDSNLTYQGNCTEDDVIEHIFGDVNNFANMVEEHGDEFTVGDLVVKYDPETDVHSFYYKKQGVAEGSEKQLLKQVKQYCRDAWMSNGKLWVDCDPLQAKKISQMLNVKPISGSVSGEYAFDIKQGVAEGRKPFRDLKSWADHAKSQGLKVSPSNHIDWTHDATDKQGKVRGRFVTTHVPQNSRGFIHQQDVTEGHKESYVIVRTDREGKKDVFAGNFDTYEQAQKELDACLAHPLHTKHKQKFQIQRKGQQDITEMDKSEPSAGRDTGPRSGPDREAKPITAKKATKDAADMLTRTVKDSHKKDVKESDTLMLKLKRALIREGRVKELADDLKTMADTDFMKKYGKAKAAIRKEMTRVDEAAPANYTPEEMSDILSGKKTQQQVDAERAQKAKVDDTAKKWQDAEKAATRVDSQGRRIDKNGNPAPLPKTWTNPPITPTPGNTQQYEDLNELSTNRLAQYKTAAAKDAEAADKAGDIKRGDKRFSGIVKATKKQFDNDAKKVDESRAARRELMAQIVNSR